MEAYGSFEEIQAQGVELMELVKCQGTEDDDGKEGQQDLK